MNVTNIYTPLRCISCNVAFPSPAACEMTLLLSPNVSLTATTVATASTGLRRRKMSSRLETQIAPQPLLGRTEEDKSQSVCAPQTEGDGQPGCPHAAAAAVLCVLGRQQLRWNKGSPKQTVLSPVCGGCGDATFPAFRCFSHPLDCAGSEPVLGQDYVLVLNC